MAIAVRVVRGDVGEDGMAGSELDGLPVFDVLQNSGGWSKWHRMRDRFSDSLFFDVQREEVSVTRAYSFGGV